MNSKTNTERYYEWLKANPKKANKKVLATYKRMVEDIHHPFICEYKDQETGDIAKRVYVFDIQKAQKPIEFIEKFCKHSKGKWSNSPIKLELWQKAFIESVFGFVDQETGLRRYRKAVLFVAKKNGKTTLGSCLGLYGLMADGEGGSEVYSVAKVKDQAKICWTEAKHMVSKSPVLNNRLRQTISGIYYDRKEGVFAPLSSEAKNLDGKSPYYTLADEVWAWEDMELLSMMEDGMSAREQPILFELSTMGSVRGKVFDQEYDYCERVIKGYLGQEGGINDDYILPVIYELDDPNEWKNEECWFKANPNLNVSKSLDYMRDVVNKAQNDNIKITNLLCKDFNVRQTSTQTWLSYEELNNNETYSDEMNDCYAIGGCDLSSTTDLTCATLLVQNKGKIYVKQMYFMPSSNLDYRVNEDKIPYDKWSKLGWLKICDGSKVNYSDVTNWFIKEVEENGIRPLWVGYDSWNANYWKDEMSSYGFDMVEVRQGAKTMSSPMKQLKADLKDKIVNYNNNPILKWCLSNLAIKSDENENIRPVKIHATQRIDGAVSLIDAYCVLIEHQEDYRNMMGG